jgi:DNA (cytosine-5)-methyltransferase 1
VIRIREVPDLPATFGIVDLFAGPGGLGEGFASLEAGGQHPFHIGISIEKETSAHRTLGRVAKAVEILLRRAPSI